MGVRAEQCSCSHLQALLVMAPCGKIALLFLLADAALGARQLRNNQQRGSRSLTGTFPFNQQNGAAEDPHHHAHHEDHHAPASLDSRAERQGDDVAVDFGAVAAAGPGADGKRCIDEVVQCDHSYDRRCHTTYVTNYESQQEEECEENFRKNCFINYEKIAFNETVQVCRTPLVKDCDVQGPEICRTEYESECWTKQEKHDVEDDVVECETIQDEKCEDETSGYTTFTKCSKWPREVCNVNKKKVKKYTPITGCTKEPRELCAPAGCGFKEGAETCYEKTQTVVQDVPKEECSLEPQRTCGHVTKLVPKLEPAEECVDVPKEVCTRSKSNPRKVKKPVVKKWCYVPSEESGLA